MHMYKPHSGMIPPMPKSSPTNASNGDGHPDPSGAGPRNQIGWATDSPHFRAKQCNLTINSGLPSGNLT